MTRIIRIFRATLLLLIALFCCNQLTASALSSLQASQPHVGVYLDSDSGRFWTRDKVEGSADIPFSLQSYFYGNLDPINNLDSSGYETIAGLAEAQADSETVAKSAFIVRAADVVSKLRNVTCKATDYGVDAYLIVNWHHPIDKVLGGNADQVMAPLSDEIHVEYHRLANYLIRATGFLKSTRGGPGNGTDQVLDYLANNPGAQKAAIEASKRAAKIVDRICGTKIYDKIEINLQEGNYTKF